MLYCWHQKWPNLFNNGISIRSFISGLLKVLCILAISSAPFWIIYFENKPINWEVTVYSIIALSLCMVYIWCYDFNSKRRRVSSQHRENTIMLAQRQTQVFDELANLVDVDGGVHSAQVDKVIERILNCIDRTVQMHLKENTEQYFEVTLMVFLKGENKAHIGWRAHGTRPTNVKKDVTDTVAYYVAKTGVDFKAIHDLKKNAVFPFKGLSEEGEPPYRSILLCPVKSEGICRGVVSIDASKPYEFWGAMQTDLYHTIRPYLRLIDLLLNNENYELAIDPRT
jgi:hypothetical protein